MLAPTVMSTVGFPADRSPERVLEERFSVDEALQIQCDDSGGVVCGEVAEQFRCRDIGLVADRHEPGNPEAIPATDGGQL